MPTTTLVPEPFATLSEVHDVPMLTAVVRVPRVETSHDATGAIVRAAADRMREIVAVTVGEPLADVVVVSADGASPFPGFPDMTVRVEVNARFRALAGEDPTTADVAHTLPAATAALRNLLERALRDGNRDERGDPLPVAAYRKHVAGLFVRDFRAFGPANLERFRVGVRACLGADLPGERAARETFLAGLLEAIDAAEAGR